MNGPYLYKLVCILTLIAVLATLPVSGFAADGGADPYDASYAQGHFLNPPPVYDPPTYPIQQSSNPAPVVLPVPDRGILISAPPVSNPSLGAASPTYASAVAMSPASNSVSSLDLGSRTGVEIGGQISDYRYQEHVHEHPEFMHEVGPKFGITATATKVFPSQWFITGDTRFAYGQNHYSSPGSGTESGVPDYLGELRVLGGRDFILTQTRIGFSPYLGLGYRNLLNDLRGTTSTGAEGYRRDSQYLYLPVGVIGRFGVNDKARMAINMEYDQLLYGQEKTYLSDIGGGDVTNDQNSGYGLRGSLMYELTHWSMGPFFDYWNINRSDLGSYGSYEPHNQTIEYGLQVKYRFQ